MPAGIINKQKNRTHNAYEAILVIQNSHNLSGMEIKRWGHNPEYKNEIQLTTTVFYNHVLQYLYTKGSKENAYRLT